ncbi:mycothiol synthase [Streptomyces calidiresistens]|uniref:Mycothiol acetyltransferase n=1 Tax=Streptomyces calidiresistens TaxID=1485586 RepID=A0A7W3T361_9ACTN|nr:mycothiol synthase [Streptomyces calidiresistens]MBB0230089.1 mycothiol synthase [Streptomyces calidiresistens]
MSDVVVLEDLSAEDIREAGRLVDAALAVDGRSPLSEQSRLLLRGGRREGVRHVLLRRDGVLVGYALLDGTDPIEAASAELVVHPDHRGRRYGRVLGEALLAESGHRLRVWAHGGHPAARHLAQALGMVLFRELRQLRRPLGGLRPGEPRLPEGVRLRTFEPGRDEEPWLALNAAAFAHHPEQGALTRRDLDARMDEPWFDPAGFFLAVRDRETTAGEGSTGGAADPEELLGFHWTKVHPAEALGEVYVLGVSPSAQHLGLGRALTAVGLEYLARRRGLAHAMLYVDADNTPALRLYEGLGFRTFEVDLMYRTES